MQGLPLQKTSLYRWTHAHTYAYVVSYMTTIIETTRVTRESLLITTDMWRKCICCYVLVNKMCFYSLLYHVGRQRKRNYHRTRHGWLYSSCCSETLPIPHPALRGSMGDMMMGIKVVHSGWCMVVRYKCLLSVHCFYQWNGRRKMRFTSAEWPYYSSWFCEQLTIIGRIGLCYGAGWTWLREQLSAKCVVQWLPFKKCHQARQWGATEPLVEASLLTTEG